MSTFSLTLPESVYKHACKLAQQDGISIDQFIATAVAEKIAVLMTVEYLQETRQAGEPREVRDRAGQGAGCGARGI